MPGAARTARARTDTLEVSIMNNLITLPKGPRQERIKNVKAPLYVHYETEQEGYLLRMALADLRANKARQIEREKRKKNLALVRA